jgi:hypothetical protein
LDVVFPLLSFFSILLTVTMVAAMLWFVFTVGPLLRRWLLRELGETGPSIHH